MAQADAEHRALAHQLAHGVHHVIQRRGVAGAVGQEVGVGVPGAQLGGAGGAGMQLDGGAPPAQVLHDRGLDPGVQGDHARPAAGAARGTEHDPLSRRDLAGQVAAVHSRLGLHQPARLLLRQLRREDAAPHRAPFADVAHQRPRVHAGDGRDPAVDQPVQPAALGARRVLAVDRRPHDRRARVDPVGLCGLRAHPVVAHVGVGERDQLSGIRGVRDRLLVAGHGGVEHDLAHRGRVGGAQVAVEAGAVLQQDEAGPPAHLTSPWIRLNSSVPARPTSSNRAISVEVTQAPERSIFSRPNFLFWALRELTASAATWTSTS